MRDKRRDSGEYYPGGRVIARPGTTPQQVVVQWSDVQGKPQIAPLPERYKDSDMKTKINEIAAKFATAVAVALVGWSAIAGLVVHKAPKASIYNDDEIVTNVIFDASDLPAPDYSTGNAQLVETVRASVPVVMDGSKAVTTNASGQICLPLHFTIPAEIAAWSSKTTYHVGDVVKQSGRYWYCVYEGSYRNTPSATAKHWVDVTWEVATKPNIYKVGDDLVIEQDSGQRRKIELRHGAGYDYDRAELSAAGLILERSDDGDNFRSLSFSLYPDDARAAAQLLIYNVDEAVETATVVGFPVGRRGMVAFENDVSAALDLKADKSSISATDPTFSNAVLAVGLNIDDETLQWLKDIGAIAGSTTGQVGIGTLLAAILAALMWLKKNKVGSFESVGGASATVEDGVAKLSDFFTSSNSLLTSRVNTLIDAKVDDANAVLAAALDGTEVA